MSKEDDCTVHADLDGNGHTWAYMSDTALKCQLCGSTEKVANVEGYSEEEAPEWPESKDIGLEKFT